MSNEITVTITPAHSPTSFTREQRHAHGALGGAVSLQIARKDRGGLLVSWSVNKGAGWRRPWTASFATETEAFSFAGEKWPVLTSWLEKLDPTPSDGAAAAFSAQVASMH